MPVRVLAPAQCRGHAQPSEVKYEKQQMLREEEDVKQMMTQLIRLKSRLDHRDYYLLEGQLEPLVDQVRLARLWVP